MVHSNRNRLKNIWIILLPILLLGISAQAQILPVFRIGVIDSAFGPISRGARLAVEEINAAGGVEGADGTVFRLELVIASSDISTAVETINQASVIAVLGPESADNVLPNLSILQSLGVPILTPAIDDTIVAIDTTDRIFRIRAQEVLLGQALAEYLRDNLGITRITTVQLDLESTAGIIGFSTALTGLGLAPAPNLLLDGNNELEDIVTEIIRSNPEAIVTYGPPAEASVLYAQLRAGGWNGRFAYNQANLADFRSLLPPQQLTGVIGTSTWAYTTNTPASTAFLDTYIRAFGSIPGPIEASAYDAIYLLAEAIGRPGDLITNLATISDFAGVQGTLSPASLPRGELSDVVAITELGIFGAPVMAARYAGGNQIDSGEVVGPGPTPTPSATATPEGIFLTVTRAVQNVRTGPGLNYDVIGQLRQGQTAEVIGANIDFSWVVIEFRGQQAWLSRSILDITGNLNTLPVIAAPPTPTPSPTLTPLPATLTPTPQPFPDLVVIGAAPTRLVIGQPFTVTVSVLNQGANVAGPFALATTLLPGNVYSAVNLTGLAAGQSIAANLSGTLGTGPTGPQSVVIVADLNNQINEGPAGEANNTAFLYNYIADAPLLQGSPAIGTLTVADLNTVTLDGGTQDIQWAAGGLVPMGATELVVLNGVSNIDMVHRDLIASAPLMNATITPIMPGMFIGIRTDDGQNYGVLQVLQATAGGTVQFNFRMYD